MCGAFCQNNLPDDLIIRWKICFSFLRIKLNLQLFFFQIDANYRDDRAYLQTITSQMTFVKSPNEATELINKLDAYISEHEATQLERLNQLASVSKTVYGFDKTMDKYSDNIELFQSFFTTKSHLNGLIEQFYDQRETERREQEQRDQEQREQERERLEREQCERDRLERERLDRERVDRERFDRERIERERLDRERIEKERLDRERIEREQFERDRLERERRDHELREHERRETQEKKRESEQLQRQQHEELLEIQQFEYHEAVTAQEAPRFIRPLCDATTQEGNQFQFECQVVGNPVPTVEWAKDGISIDRYPDYVPRNENGLCTLSIAETFTEDSALFTCRAKNAMGTSETAARLLIVDAEPENTLLPPKFIKPLQNFNLSKGASLLLECLVEGNPLPEIQWNKNDECIDNSPQYEITYNNGEAILRLDNVSAGDQAVYTCTAKNMLDVAQSAAVVNVDDIHSTLPKSTAGEFYAFVVFLHFFSLFSDHY